MTDLTEIEKAWCEWMRRFRGNRSGEPASVTTFAAGAAYERARIRREMLEAIGGLDDIFAFNRWSGVKDYLRNAVDKIVPGEG